MNNNMNNKMYSIFTASLFTVIALAFSVSGVLNAATYDFVDSSGNLRSVTANSSSEALLIAPNIGLHSGVVLHNGSNPVVVYTGSVSSGQYLYVNSSGIAVAVNANSVAEAFARAINISPHSGVMLIR